MTPDQQGAPKVSVCMIAYKHEAYIRQAIESILAQEVDFPIELVIGDDSSPDGTAAICEEFARRDPRVRLLPRERNLGVMPNFTRTLLACTGEYIAVCEGDDYWTDTNKLSKQVAFLDSHPDYAGSAHQATVISVNKADRPFRDNVRADLSTNDLLGGRLFHTASIVFKRAALDLFCNSPQVLSCDRLLNICISILGQIKYFKESMCVYRIHGAGMSSLVTSEQLKLDLNCIPYLKQISSIFPDSRYKSYVFATIGLWKGTRPLQRLQYLALSIIYSFSYFPENVLDGVKYIWKSPTRRT